MKQMVEMVAKQLGTTPYAVFVIAYAYYDPEKEVNVVVEFFHQYIVRGLVPNCVIDLCLDILTHRVKITVDQVPRDNGKKRITIQRLRK